MPFKVIALTRLDVFSIIGLALIGGFFLKWHTNITDGVYSPQIYSIMHIYIFILLLILMVC